MKKQIIVKIIPAIILFSFILSFSQFILPSKVNAAASTGLNWDNPNAKGNSPYKINTDTILNSATMMKVVGCTGLVDKVTTLTTDFLKNQADKIIQKIWKKDAIEEKKVELCSVAKETLTNAAAAMLNTQYTTSLATSIDCKPTSNVSDKKAVAAIKNDTKKSDAAAKREECFNGLAYTLAKNQLTSMTRQTVNWVNTGFNGNPMYVQNITSLTNSIEKNILETGIAKLSNGAFPYGRDFARTMVTSYNTGGTKYGATNFLDSLTSDLSYFVTDTNSYGTSSYYDDDGNFIEGIKDTRTALQRSQDANDGFTNDFSSGGWDGYMALTQRDQNNPLGFAMQTSQYLSDRIAQQTNETKDELITNNGFMSQKKCVLWQYYNDLGVMQSRWNYLTKKFEDETGPDKRSDSSNDKCIKYEVVTPGSIIKDKLTTYINSPERQLELADTINKSLNSLFTSLIEKFRNEGLFGLSTSKDQYEYLGANSANMGMGHGSTGIGYEEGDDYNLNFNNSGGGFNPNSFDLTRDLGNTYNHSSTYSLGNWNAKTNTPELYIGLAPFEETCKKSCTEGDICTGYCPANYYYTVSYDGNTKLFNNGYNGWTKGDRAFWNGKEWQNWKCNPNAAGKCTGQTSPVAIRGIIQVQKDYVVAAKEILKIIPSIMPKMGELDYCIPGPNPLFEGNSGDAATKFGDYTGSLSSLFKDGSFFVRDSTSFSVGLPGSNIYKDYQNVFAGTTLWDAVRNTYPWISLQAVGGGGSAKKDRAEGRITSEVDYTINLIQEEIKKFYIEYAKVFKNFYSTMQNEFLEKENVSVLPKNPAYVEMINDGYSYTKNIVSYNDDINTAIEDYNTSIVQAQTNTQKLNNILSEVSKIIKAAQDRRDANLLVQINKLNEFEIETCKANKIECDNNTKNNTQCLVEYNQCIANTAGVLSVAEYKTKYAACFDEEDILYYDDRDIMNDSSDDESLRCGDGLDNDLDGLIDKLDPDCGGAVGPVYRCTTGASVSNETENPQNAPCASRDTESECLSDFYYHQSSANVCNWITGADPIKYSLYGCIIDSNVLPKPVPESGNKDCLDRNESECTVNKYIDETGMSYSCQFTAL